MGHKGVGVGEGYAPSCAERGKLKYNMVSIFSTSYVNATLGFRTNKCVCGGEGGRRGTEPLDGGNTPCWALCT